MPKITYIGTDEGDDAECTVFGVTFERNVAQDVDAGVADRLAGNPSFAASGAKGKAAKTAEPDAAEEGVGA